RCTRRGHGAPRPRARSSPETTAAGGNYNTGQNTNPLANFRRSRAPEWHGEDHVPFPRLPIPAHPSIRGSTDLVHDTIGHLRYTRRIICENPMVRYFRSV